MRRGEAAVLVRFEGNYAATTVTIMGDRIGFVWKAPPDKTTSTSWSTRNCKVVKTLPSGLCTDADFIRRVYLDLTGLPPTSDDVRAFLADSTQHRK